MKNKVLKTKKNLKNSTKHLSNNSIDRKNIKKNVPYSGTDFPELLKPFQTVSNLI